MKNKLLLVLFFLTCLTFCDCSKKSGLDNISLPSDTAINDANRYALIIKTYISIYDKAGNQGIAIAHARKRDVFPIESIEIVQSDGGQSLWIGLSGGWVPSSCVELYSTREKALTASKKLN